MTETTTDTGTFWICATCAVEHAEQVPVCRICDDERQWVPTAGQSWLTLDGLSDREVAITELEPDLFGLTVEPKLGIGQTMKLVRTRSGNLLWDPIGYLDDDAVARVRELGEVVAIAASHPHMFGVQIEWSRRLGGAPVLVPSADREWVARPDPAIREWSGTCEVAPGLVLSQVGGHFPGSAIAVWSAGAGGRGVLLSGDTLFANPDRRSVSFMRSYPNHLPLSAGVAERIAEHLGRFTFDRIYGNFQNAIDSDGAAIVQRSAARHAGWARGAFDHLT